MFVPSGDNPPPGENALRFYDPKTCGRVDVKDVKIGLERGLVPSVSSILNMIHHEHLVTWRIKKALENYTATGDTDGSVNFSDNTSSDFGTSCHGLVEQYVTGIATEEHYDNRHLNAVAPVLRWIDSNVTEFVFSEAQFASADLGYGGTADLLFRLNDGRLILADLKCKKHSKHFPLKPNLEYKYQLSAYRRHFQQIYGEMGMMNLLIASPFGWSPQPRLEVFDHGDRDWGPGFDACHHLFLETNGIDLTTSADFRETVTPQEVVEGDIEVYDTEYPFEWEGDHVMPADVS